MTRWQWSSRDKSDTVLALATVTMVALLSLATACPDQCQCSQLYYVYCVAVGLGPDSLHDLVSVVPPEAVLLDLSSNSLDALAAGELDPLPDLEYLLVADNDLHTLGKATFRALCNLKELSLRNNLLKEIPGSVFFNLTYLRTLHLDGNFVETIRKGAFSLSSLVDLNLQRNKLTILQPGQLSGMPSLQALDLSDNLIQTLEVGAFRELTGLQKLWLSKNRLASLAENVFQGLTSLRELYLDGNMLPSLDCFDVPNFANTLQRLTLTDNSLVAVPHDVFSKLHNLRTLALDNNRIASVGQQAFRGLKLDNLTLAHNLLKVIDRKMFEGARRISSLDLSHNRIHTIKTGAFDSFRESLYVLDLSANQVTSLDHGTLRGMRNLQTLNLSSNALRTIMVGTFLEMVGLSVLDLDHNRLKTLSASALEGPALQRLSLLDNPISELTGFAPDDASHPASIWVNLTLRASSADSVTVTWPYRRALYYQLRVWCVTGSDGDSACGGSGEASSSSTLPIVDSSVPPNEVSRTVSGLRPSRRYTVCVQPVFVTKEVQVHQCRVVTTAPLPVTTARPQSHGSGLSASSRAARLRAGSWGGRGDGDGALLRACLCVSAFVSTATALWPFWLDAVTTSLLTLLVSAGFGRRRAVQPPGPCLACSEPVCHAPLDLRRWR